MDHVTKLKRLLQNGRIDIYGRKEVGKEFDKIEKNVKNKEYKKLQKDFEKLENAIRLNFNKTIATSVLTNTEYNSSKRCLLQMEHTQLTVGGKSVVKVKNEVEMKAAEMGGQYKLDLTTIAESVNRLTGALTGSHHIPGQVWANVAGYCPIPMAGDVQLIQAHIESLQSEVETFKKELINTCRPFVDKDKIKRISTQSGLREILSQLETIFISNNEMEKPQKTLGSDKEQVARMMDTDGGEYYKTRYQHIHAWIVWLHEVTESSKSQQPTPPDQPEQFPVKTSDRSEVTQLEKILQETSVHIQQLNQRIKAQIEDKEASVQELKRKLQKANERHDELERSRQHTEQRLHSAKRRDMRAEIERFRKENHRLTDDLHEALAKKEYWMTRLSSIAGAKLVDGNPAITDLSDPNRPQKLAERFAELYDNEWTNALETLTGGNAERETEAVCNLAALLRATHDYCTNFHHKQFQTMVNTLLLPGEVTDKTQNKENEAITIPIEVKNTIQDLQKETANQAREAVLKKFDMKLQDDNKTLHKIAKSIPGFVHECFEICWMMTLHNPPPCFFWPDPSKGQTIDQNMFTFFTRSGVTIDYVVWPAMLLHEGGPLLRKGVVQPIGN